MPIMRQMLTGAPTSSASADGAAAGGFDLLGGDLLGGIGGTFSPFCARQCHSLFIALVVCRAYAILV